MAYECRAFWFGGSCHELVSFASPVFQIHVERSNQEAVQARAVAAMHIMSDLIVAEQSGSGKFSLLRVSRVWLRVCLMHVINVG